MRNTIKKLVSARKGAKSQRKTSWNFVLNFVLQKNYFSLNNGFNRNNNAIKSIMQKTIIF
jgi:hypothetical protein